GRGLNFSDSEQSIAGFQAYVRALEREHSAAAASAFSANDFEAAVFEQHPQLKLISNKLAKAAAGARMTGSGSTIFTLFASRKRRARDKKRIETDPIFRGARIIPAALVTRRTYWRLWRHDLGVK